MLHHHDRQETILYIVLIALVISSLVAFCRPRTAHTVTEPAPLTVETPKTPNDPFYNRWN